MNTLCECGCGNQAPQGKTYISGHNMRGKKRKPHISKKCLYCSTEMTGTEKAIGNRVYCSPSCRDEHRKNVLVGPSNPKYKRVEVKCAVCGKPVLVIPCRVSARQDQYCSPECGRIGQARKLTGTEKTATHWRTLAKREYGKACAICGFPHFVEVHHIIHRAKGGGDEISNLLPLCPNHHGMVHANLISVSDLRKAQAAAKAKQLHLDVVVWDQYDDRLTPSQ